MSYQSDRDEFIVTIVKEGGTLDAARSIMRQAGIAQRHAVNECNREVTAEEKNRASKAVAAIRTTASAFGAKVKAGGDPRGYVVKLLLKSGRYNTFGGPEEGYGVPTR